MENLFGSVLCGCVNRINLFNVSVYLTTNKRIFIKQSRRYDITSSASSPQSRSEITIQKRSCYKPDILGLPAYKRASGVIQHNRIIQVERHQYMARHIGYILQVGYWVIEICKAYNGLNKFTLFVV